MRLKIEYREAIISTDFIRKYPEYLEKTVRELLKDYKTLK